MVLATATESPPKELRDLSRWAVWKTETRNGRPTKVPYVQRGQKAKTNRADHWTTYEAALAKVDGFDGLGFVFAKGDGLVGVDLDDIRDKTTGIIDAWAVDIIRGLDTYAEISPSGTGVKLWGYGSLPTEKTGKKEKYKTGGVEMYQHGRYFAWTGEALEGTPGQVNSRPDQINSLWRKIFDPTKADEPNDFDRCKIALLDLPKSVDGEHGHDKLFLAANEIYRYGFDGSEAYDLLDFYSEQRSDPPWSSEEIKHKLRSAKDEILRTREFGTKASKSKGFKLNSVGAATFRKRTYPRNFLVHGLVVHGEPLVIGGPKKSLKTSLALDLAVSVASGTPFLGHEPFRIRKQVPVLVISGESGEATLKATCDAICNARGVNPTDEQLRFSFQLPQLSLPEHLKAIEHEIREHKTGLLIVDPLYLCLLDSKTSQQAGNVFAMGSILKGLGPIGSENDCTLAVLHHISKGATRARKNGLGKPELDDLSQSGVAEWARQWLLLNHRAAYAKGFFQLFMVAGGSAGHGGEYGVDVDQGDPDDPLVPEARRWDVTVHDADEIKSESDKREAEKLEPLAAMIFEAVPDEGITKTALAKAVRSSKSKRFDRAIASLGGQVVWSSEGVGGRAREVLKKVEVEAATEGPF